MFYYINFELLLFNYFLQYKSAILRQAQNKLLLSSHESGTLN